MRETIRKKFIILLSLTVLLGFSACTATQQTADTIKLGLSAPLSGEIASLGENALAGVTLAVADINAKGGIDGKQVELVVEDDECSSASVGAFQKMLNIDDVVGIIGPICSSAAGPGAPLAQQAQTPVVMIAASNPKLAAIGDFIFRVYPSDAFSGVEAARFIYDDLKEQQVGLIFAQEEYGVALGQAFKEDFERRGGVIGYEAGIDRDQQDLRTELSKLQEAGINTIFMPAWPPSVIAIDKQAEELDFELNIIGGDTYETEELLTSGSAQGAHYIVPKVPLDQDFVTRVNAQPGFENLQVAIFASLAYDAAMVMMDAIDRADSTQGPQIRDALFQTAFTDGVSNERIEFTDIGELTEPRYEIKRIEGDKGVPIN